jgi:hypothetical protein
MKSSRVFSALEATLVQLEHAMAEFMSETAPLSESLRFVGLETTVLNVTSAITKASEAGREVQEIIRKMAETTVSSTSKHSTRAFAHRASSNACAPQTIRTPIFPPPSRAFRVSPASARVNQTQSCPLSRPKLSISPIHKLGLVMV